VHLGALEPSDRGAKVPEPKQPASSSPSSSSSSIPPKQTPTGTARDQDQAQAQKKKKTTTETSKGATGLQEIASQEKEKGNKAFSQKRFKEAIECWERARALDPQNPVLPANQAQAWIELENWERAQQTASEAVVLQNDNQKALYRRAFALFKLDLLPSAMQDLDHVLHLNPSNAQVSLPLSLISVDLWRSTDVV